MQKYETFEYTPQTLAEQLTNQSHMTLYWLNRNGYLNNDQTSNLLSRLICAPVRNKPSFGQRILDRLFKKDASENSYMFPITLLEEYNELSTHSGKPTLTVVK